MVTDKNERQFKSWYYNECLNEEIDYYSFVLLPFEMQIGVYLAYYDSLDLLIGIEYQYGFKWTLLEVNEGQDFHCGGFDTRNEAYKEAFKKANDLINKI